MIVPYNIERFRESAPRITSAPVLWVWLALADDRRRSHIDLVEAGDMLADSTVAAMLGLVVSAYAVVVVQGPDNAVLNCGRLIREVRSRQPWFAISDNTDDHFERAARELGALAVLEPNAPDALLQQLLNALRLRQWIAG